MEINNTLNRNKVRIGYSICEFHRKYPMEKYAGCTCSSHYKLMREEVFNNQERRERENVCL